MKAIRTITCHNVYNYGASLQAYALQQYLTNIGYNVEIINYIPKYLNLRYKPFFISPESKYYKISKIFPPILLIKLYTNRYMFKSWGRKRRFDLFTSTYLKLTDKVYKNINDLIANPPVANIYIAGSDQIWNSEMPNGKDPSFYLQFGPPTVQRVSYAASFGITSLAQKNIPQITKWLKSFDKISVREESGIKIIQQLDINKKITKTIDPVFLLSPHEWRDLYKSSTAKIVDKPYILLYDFLQNDIKVKELTLKLSEQKGLPIISVNDYMEVSYATKNINNAGPIEFLQLIDNAAYVVSTSFHATAFSILFHKDFFTFPLKGLNNSSRMENLLSICKISDRLNTDTNNIAAFSSNIDWETVDSNIKEIIKTSTNFLNL